RRFATWECSGAVGMVRRRRPAPPPGCGLDDRNLGGGAPLRKVDVAGGGRRCVAVSCGGRCPARTLPHGRTCSAQLFAPLRPSRNGSTVVASTGAENSS